MNQSDKQIAVEKVIERLAHHNLRIKHTLYNARALQQMWAAINSAFLGNGKLGGSANSALATLWKAALNDQILMLVRLLDQPGRDVWKTDRVSYPVLDELFRIDGVENALKERFEKNPLQDNCDELRATFDAHLVSFRQRLNSLKSEQPNRATLLRDFRDENLAHELYFEQPRPKPLYRHIKEMLGELEQLGTDTTLLIEHADQYWDTLDDEYEASIGALIGKLVS